MEADAASGNPTKISMNTDSQFQKSRKRKMSESSCNPGMQNKNMSCFSCYCSPVQYYIQRGEAIVRLFKGTFSYRTCSRLRSYYIEVYY